MLHVVSILHLKAHGRLKTFSESRRAKTKQETTSVFFILHIDFENITHIHRF